MNFEHLVEGDSVGVVSQFGYGANPEYRVLVIDKITKHHIVIGSLKYKKLNGNLVGRGTDHLISCLMTVEDAEKNAAYKTKEREIKIATSDLKKATEALGNLDAETLDAIQAKLDALRALI